MKFLSLPSYSHRHFARATQWGGGVLLAMMLTASASAQTILGTTGSYGVMGGGVVTVTGSTTTINGDLGAGSLVGSVNYGSTGTQITPLTAQNITDFDRAYTGLNDLTFTSNLTGTVLGSGVSNLASGVYLFTTAAALTGNLVLDAGGQSNAVWVFQMDSTFNTTASSSVTISNAVGGSETSYGVYWQVAGASVFGADTLFKGNLLSGSTIGLGTGVQVDGRLLTATGTVGLAAGDSIDFIGASSGYSGGLAFSGAGTAITAVPEPSTYALLAGLAGLGLMMVRRRLLKTKIAR